MTIASAVYDSLPPEFVAWYRSAFVGTRMIYGHWSEGPYSRSVGAHHRQIAVLRPLDLDEMIDRYVETRQRRIGGAIAGMWHEIEEMKRQAEIQIFDGAPFDQDLSGHTRGRDMGSVALSIMGARGARLNDLGPRAPLPLQLRAMVDLVAQAAFELRTPVERFMTQSEAADNLDLADPTAAAAPTPAHGFSTTREAWGLEAWIDVTTEELAAPLLTARPGWMRLGDWVREQALRRLVIVSRPSWATYDSAESLK